MSTTAVGEILCTYIFKVSTDPEVAGMFHGLYNFFYFIVIFVFCILISFCICMGFKEAICPGEKGRDGGCAGCGAGCSSGGGGCGGGGCGGG